MRALQHLTRAASCLCVLPASAFVSGFVRPPPKNSCSMASPSVSATRRGLTTMNVKVSDVLKDPKWPEEAFFRATDFQRQDESTDTSFYNSPRFVTHIDDPAIKALTGTCFPQLGHLSSLFWPSLSDLIFISCYLVLCRLLLPPSIHFNPHSFPSPLL